MSNVVNICPPTDAEDIVKILTEAKDTEELYVLRVSYLEGGDRRIDWLTTGGSRIWAVGALNYLSHKLMEIGE